MIVYLAGPISNNPNHKAHFAAGERKLKDAGHIVLSQSGLPSGLTERAYMAICMCMLEQAEAIYMLPGWGNSDGATAEYAYAVKLGIQIMGDV